MRNEWGYRQLLAAAGVACILFLGVPAQASTIDYVSTYSRTIVDSIAYDSIAGLTETLPTSTAGQPITVSSFTSNPSTDVTGLTSASNSIAATKFDPNTNLTTGGNASAYANLATGMVGAGAFGESSQAGGQIQDTVTFNNTTGHVVDITVSWTFDGTFTGGPFGSVDSLFCLSSTNSCVAGALFIGAQPPQNGGQFFRLQDGVSLGSPTITDPSTAQWVSAAFTQGINADLGTFSGLFAVPTGLSTDSLSAYINVTSVSDNVDFTHTGALSFSGLNGVTYTSGSGVLLTQTAAPEPGGWMLVLAGLGSIGLTLRRKLVLP
jgi:hypothetical protein